MMIKNSIFIKGQLRKVRKERERFLPLPLILLFTFPPNAG